MAKQQIFPDNITLQQLNEMSEGCMVAHLGIEYVEIGNDYLVAKMPVDHRTKQPMGLLHGGASVVLAETLGSIAANLVLDAKKQYAVGLEINANHIKSATDGYVVGSATAVHLGRKTHVWTIDIRNEKKQLIAMSRLTVAILDKKK